MSVQNRSLFWAFVTTLCFTLFCPALFPSLRLTFFAPFLVIVFYQRPYLRALWFAALCGTIIDLLTATPRLGLYAVNYSIAAALLYGQRRHFFADSFSTMPLMTFFFCIITTLIQAVQMYIFDRHWIFNGQWLFTDLLVMPLADALYGLVVFILPYALFGKRVRRGSEYFV